MKKICFLALFALCIGTSINSFAQTKTDTTAKYTYGSETYPGIQPGEVFYTLISNGWYLNKSGLWGFWKEGAAGINFKEIPWKTKRMGYLAYSKDGELLEDYYPVFVEKEELIKAGVLK